MWVAVGVIAASSVYSTMEAKDAQDEAEIQAEKDREYAAEAAEFAETEGEGVGQLGNINLGIDKTIDDDLRKSGQSNLSI